MECTDVVAAKAFTGKVFWSIQLNSQIINQLLPYECCCLRLYSLGVQWYCALNTVEK